MSIRLFLTCHEHNKPLRARRESGIHLSHLLRIREEIAHRDELVAATLNGSLGEYLNLKGWNRWFSTASAAFLVHHRACRIGIGIVDEYGRPYSLVNDADRGAVPDRQHYIRATSVGA